MTMSSTPQKNTEPPGQACCVCKKKSACGHPGRNEDRRWTPRGLCLASFSSWGRGDGAATLYHVSAACTKPCCSLGCQAGFALPISTGSRGPIPLQDASFISTSTAVLHGRGMAVCSDTGWGGVGWGGSGGHLRFSLGCVVWNRVSGRSLHDGGFESVLFLRDSSSCEFDGGVSGTVLNIC